MKSTKRIFNVASYKRFDTLLKMLESIHEQADVINVVMNYDYDVKYWEKRVEKDTIEERFEKCNVLWAFNEIGDGEKFSELMESDGYFFTVDDDLLYPQNYAEFMIDAFERYEGRAIMALHGRNFHSWPIESYYNSPFTKYRVLGSVTHDVQVEFAGTCVTMWHTDLMKLNPYEVILHPNMGDIWLAQEAAKLNIPIICLAHDATFVDYLLNKEDETIFTKYKKEHSIQTEVANRIYCK